MSDHPTRRLEDVVHQRSRLGILTALAEAPKVDFGYLKDLLGLTDGNLSTHRANVCHDGQRDRVEVAEQTRFVCARPRAH